MLVVRQNADTFTIMSQEFYSSASSDDQSSINSVVHVDVGDSTTDGEEGEAEEPGQAADDDLQPEAAADYDDDGDEEPVHNQANNPAQRLPKVIRSLPSHAADSSSDSDDDGIIRDSADHESDSSSSSEGTQVWVPVKASPGPSAKSSAGRNGTPLVRHSVVSQSSVSGRAETSLIHDEHHHINGADSGISNESPDTTSSADHHYHHGHHHHHHHSYQHHPAGGRPASHIVPMPALHSPARTPNTEEVEVVPVQQEHPEPGLSIKESLFNILSGLYALVLVTMGAALPVAEIFATPVAPGVFETFYIYLFGMSIVFLLYVYTFLLSERTTSRLCRRAHPGEDSPFNKWSRRVSIGGNPHTGSFYLRLGAVAFGVGSMIHEGLMFGELFEFELTSPCVRLTEAIRPVLQLAFTFIQLYFIFLNSKMCIHKYRTLARFGLTHMVATNLCVWFRTVTKETAREVSRYLRHSNGSMYGMHVTPSGGGKTTNMTTSLLSAVGASSLSDPPPGGQLYKVAMAGSTTTTDTPVVVRYGGTHYPEQDSPTAVLNMTLVAARRSQDECPRQEILRHVVQAASPYLYPCTIQYSLIAAGILYVMWRNISKPPTAPGAVQETSSLHSGGTAGGKGADQASVDCSGANRGLFLGIFTLVAAIISTIVFFVLVERVEYVASAVLVVHVSEVVLYCLALVAVAAAAYRIRALRFHAARDNALDECLLLVALAGQFVFCVFGAVAGHYNTQTEGGVLVVSTSVLIMLQAALQTVFILNALRRSSVRPYHAEVGKPGREYITFLLVVNIAMWGMNVLQPMRTDANPVTRLFYGLLPWSVVTHLSSPLTVFYRFHSTVCLANVWKNAYRLRPT